jgi:hypothetical protein
MHQERRVTGQPTSLTWEGSHDGHGCRRNKGLPKKPHVAVMRLPQKPNFLSKASSDLGVSS